MSEITKPMMLDDTGKRVAVALETLVSLKAGETITEWRTIRDLVRMGKGAANFPVGTQFIEKWTDSNGTEYDMPFDVVAHAPVTLEDDTETYGMILQSHYATKDAIQFSAPVPFYYASENVLAAGIYHITFGTSWGQIGAKSYQFTLANDLPVGGVLAFSNNIVDNAMSNWRVRAFATPSDETPIESVVVTEGTGGTDLGTFNSANTDVNKNEQCLSSGYNRYKESAVRQYLNSAADKGAWWKPQRIGSDLRPDQLYSVKGFLSGFSADFLAAIMPTKQQIAANTVTDGGAIDVVYDKFFLPSLEQEYCSPQISGVEGSAWEYWKKVLSTQHAQYATRTEHIRTALENHSSAQYVRLRSALRGGACHAWYVDSSGYLGTYSGSAYASRLAPACVIA